ncbi:MAG: LysM peptidoglycan-binding domain-containing protein [Myxococcota bacterium]
MRLLLPLILLSLSAWMPNLASAQREHTVRSGQSLARIARRYGVRVHDLAAANNMRVTAELRLGQTLTIPERGYHYVRQGQNLSEIANEHQVSVRELLAANRLTRNSRIRPGQRLLLPGHTASEERDEAAERWGRPRNPGMVTFFRVATRERMRIRVLARNGRPRRAAVRRLREFLRDRRTGETHEPATRLLQLISRISDHFGGRMIHVMSGYRPAGTTSRRQSRHSSGEAIDFKVRGVPNRTLIEYLRTLPNCGVGYYPNSSFVHLDVRDRRAYWVDRSGPGESADYVRPAERTEEER